MSERRRERVPVYMRVRGQECDDERERGDRVISICIYKDVSVCTERQREGAAVHSKRYSLYTQLLPNEKQN